MGPAAPTASGQHRSESADGGEQEEQEKWHLPGHQGCTDLPINPASPGRACHSHRAPVHPVLMMLGPVRSAKGSHEAELCLQAYVGWLFVPPAPAGSYVRAFLFWR